MTDLKWLDQYTGQTTDELIALEGEYRTDSLVLAFEQALDQKTARAGTEELTAEERVVLAVEALEREVNNGGYGQFFTNDSNEYTPIIVDALMRIGCGDTAASFLSCGATRAGICVDVAGTASVFATTTKTFQADMSEKTLGCGQSATPGLWHPYAYINGGGLNLEWFRKEIASAENKDQVAVDMTKVGFMDSTVIGVLVWGMKNLREVGGDYRLFGLTDAVAKLFAITRLDQAFRIFPTEGEAVASFG